MRGGLRRAPDSYEPDINPDEKFGSQRNIANRAYSCKGSAARQWTVIEADVSSDDVEQSIEKGITVARRIPINPINFTVTPQNLSPLQLRRFQGEEWQASSIRSSN